MTITTLQKIIIGVSLAIAIGIGVYQGRQASSLREQNQVLQQQQASSAEQIQSLQRERDEAAKRLGDDITRRAEATSNKVRLLSSSLLVDDPMRSAHATYAAYMIANAGKGKNPSNEIPPAYWAAGIKQLNPVKVYIHHVNIVVVQRVTDGMEEGKYICIPLSSYGSPRTGDDGFVFSRNPSDGKTFPLGYQIFDFKRTKSK